MGMAPWSLEIEECSKISKTKDHRHSRTKVKISLGNNSRIEPKRHPSSLFLMQSLFDVV